MTKHGEISNEVFCQGARKCDRHGWHGALYPCESYDANILAQIELLTIQLAGSPLVVSD